MTLEELFSSSLSPRAYDCSGDTKMGRCDAGNVDGKCGQPGSNATDCPGTKVNAGC